MLLITQVCCLKFHAYGMNLILNFIHLILPSHTPLVPPLPSLTIKQVETTLIISAWSTDKIRRRESWIKEGILNPVNSVPPEINTQRSVHLLIIGLQTCQKQVRNSSKIFKEILQIKFILCGRQKLFKLNRLIN